MCKALQLCFIYLCTALCINVINGLSCYSCPHSETVDGCKQMELCATGEICMLRVLSNSTKVFFETRCTPRKICEDALLQYQGTLTSIIGGKRELGSIALGDMCLIQCCEDDNCNNGCKIETTTTASTTVSSTDLPITKTTKVSSATTVPSSSTSTTSLTSMSTRDASSMSSSSFSTMTLDTSAAVGPFTPAPTESQTASNIVTSSTTTSTHSAATQPSPTTVSVTDQGTNTPSTFDVNSHTSSDKLTTDGTMSTVQTTGTPSTTTILYPTSSQSASLVTNATLDNDQISTNNHVSTKTTPSINIPTSVNIPGSSTDATKVPTPPMVSSTDLTLLASTEQTTTSQSSSLSQSSSSKPSTSAMSNSPVTTSPLSSATSGLKSTTPPPSCPHAYVGYKESCYLMVKREMTFIHSRDYCAHEQAYLVHIDNKEENDFIVNTLRQLNKDYMVYWIGITDNAKENEWVYADTGIITPFTNWAPNEPDNTHDLDGNADTANCAMISPHHNYTWIDQGCSVYQTGEPICEKRNPNLP